MQPVIVSLVIVFAVLFLIRRTRKQFSKKHEDCSGCAMNKSSQNQTK